MKNIYHILFVIILMSIIAFASCKKSETYSCHCKTYVQGVQTSSATLTVEGKSISEARTACDVNDWTDFSGGDAHTDCELE